MYAGRIATRGKTRAQTRRKMLGEKEQVTLGQQKVGDCLHTDIVKNFILPTT